MESNNGSTQTIIKEDTDDNHCIDLKEDPTHGDVKSKPSEMKQKGSLSSFVVAHRVHAIQLGIFALITAYLAWATHHYLQNTEELSWTAFRATTSNGYGLFVILYVLYIYCLFYYVVLKPYVLPTVARTAWKPGKERLKRVRYGSLIFYASVLAATLAFLIHDARLEPERLKPLLGLVVFLGVGVVSSAHVKFIPWHTVAWGLILQFAFGFLTIRWETGRNALETFSDHVNAFLKYGVKAAAFTYGDFLVTEQQVFAFNALSVIFFMGFVINLLYYYGLMQRFINMLGEFLRYFMGTTVCESVNSVAVAFVGMSEGPMMLRPYLQYLTDSELHSLMLAGFASVSGSTFAAYISYGARAQDLVTASIMSAPSALCFSKVLYPETETVRITKKDVRMVSVEYSSAMDAASKGATDAFHLIAAIISGVTATLAFVYFINGVLTWMGLLVGFTDETNMWTLELIAGKVFQPVAWIMGVPWDECEKVGQLIGVKTMVNEFVAFSQMGAMGLTARTKVIATYAICGFSNPGSIGILISTIAALEPLKKETATRLVFRAFVGGALVCLMTACIAAILTTDVKFESVSTNMTDYSNVTTNGTLAY